MSEKHQTSTRKRKHSTGTSETSITKEETCDEPIEIEICDCYQCNEQEQEGSSSNSTESQNSPNNVENSSSSHCNKLYREETKWQDQDVRALLEIWKTKDILINSKNPLYANKEHRMNCIDVVREELNKQGLMFSSKQISDKMTNLRTYYGGQRRSMEAAKRAGQVFVSRWKFFHELGFLSDSMVHRGSNEKEQIDSAPHSPPSFLPRKFSAKKAKSFTPHVLLHEDVDRENNDNLLTCNSSWEKAIIPAIHTRTHDEIFGELIVKMLGDFPECHEKALLKIELQHKIVAAQYKFMQKKSH